MQGLTALFARYELLTTLLWLRLEMRKIRQILAGRIGFPLQRVSAEGQRAKQLHFVT